MNDRTRITLWLGGLVAFLALVLVLAAAPSYAGAWLQQYGKTGDCAEGWGNSWAEWAVPVTGGAVCTREVDDPSQPVAAAATPTPTPTPTPSGPTWVVLLTNTLQPQELVGGSIVGWCPDGSDPQGLRAVPNTDIAVLYYAQPMEGFIENLSPNTPRTFDLEALCG